MPSYTRIHDAIARVQTEQEAVAGKLDAIDRFIDRVKDCPPVPKPASATGTTATVGPMSQCHQSSQDQCHVVRRAFVETIRPHSLDDVDETESVHETIQSELSESIAVALAPTTETTFSPQLKQAVRSKATVRRTTTEALYRALDRESSQLADARDSVEEITQWITSADETPLTELGFDELRARHETLASYRSQCEGLAEQRQTFLDRATSHGETIGVSHSELRTYLYQDFPVARPVLVTSARVDDVCIECQRIVRQHLVRRV